MQPQYKELNYTSVDKEFYIQELKSRMPARILDAHIHMNLPMHIKYISKERVLSDWAFEAGLILPVYKAFENAKKMFPETEYSAFGFPWPIQEADLKGNNAYLLEQKSKYPIHPFMSVDPNMTVSYIEENLTNFQGYKPYPDLVSNIKGAEISIFSFLPHEQLEILNKYKKAVVIHLPRKDRIADKNNIKELLEMRQKYPDIKIVIAHFGRSFNPIYLNKAIDEMHKDIGGFYFDTAAVLNPDVYELAFTNIPEDNILFGTDAPIMNWHGKRKWTDVTYINMVREPFSWNNHIEGEEKENKYTFFVYEQLKSIFDTIEKLGLSKKFKDKLFYDNAAQFARGNINI